MSPEAMIALGGVGIVVLTFVVVVSKVAIRRAPLKIKRQKVQKRWKELQKYCAHKETWPSALRAADELLDKTLIKRGFKGRNMGERLVSAQREFTENDGVWFAHKLARKAMEDASTRLKEKDVKDALMGFGQALKDLGAL